MNQDERRLARTGGALSGRLLIWGLMLSVLGCAQDQGIREQAQLSLRTGSYEQALAELSAGLKQYPESVALRSGLIQARAEALSNLLTEAFSERTAGQLDAAETTLRRALALDGNDKRVQSLLSDLDTTRRQKAALAEAEAFLDQKKPDAALRRVQQALKDNPRQPDLLSLQRRLEMDQRQGFSRANALGLAETRPISLDFRDAGLRMVLDVVTRNSGINFILDKDVRADIRVTVFLRSAKVEDAIDLLVSTHQLTKKVIDEKTVLIYPNSPDKQREYQEQVVRVFHLANGDAKGAAAFLRSMLKVREPFVDERSNMMALRESPEVIELAERLVSLFDTQEPEVLLELEVLEVRRTRLTDLGVKFPDTFSFTALGPGGAAGGLTVGNLGNIDRNRIGVSSANLLVNLKREVGDFNMLANPRIRAKSREKARVLVGDKVPVITTTTGQGGFVSDSVNYIEVGLKLDVEPTVYADDEVSIRVGLEVSSVSREVRTGSGSLAYQIGTRNATTQLRLRDGETQLLAGLISNEDRSSASRVPGIGDLPVAGRLFSSQRDDAQRTELVLAITPRVLRNPRQPEAHMAEIWVGTEALPRAKPAGGRRFPQEPGDGDPKASPARSSTEASSTDEPKAETRAAWVGPKEVKVGEIFSISLELESPKRLRGIPMRFAVNPKLLAVMDVEEGGYFQQNGGSTSFTKSVNAAAGLASAGVMRNGPEGASGKAPVVSLRLKALQAGLADISVVTLEPQAGDGSPAPASPLMPYKIEVK